MFRVVGFPQTPYHEPNRQHDAETYDRTGNAVHEAKILVGVHSWTYSFQGHPIASSAQSKTQNPWRANPWRAKSVRYRDSSSVTFLASLTMGRHSPLVPFFLVLCTVVCHAMDRTRVDFNVLRNRARCARHFRGVLLSFSSNVFSAPVGDELVSSETGKAAR